MRLKSKKSKVWIWVTAAFLMMLVTCGSSLSAEDRAPNEARGDEPPLEAVLLSYANKGKPPLPNYKLQLKIENRHDQARWYLIPYFADVPLTESGEFHCRPPRPDADGRYRFPIDVFGVKGDEGTAIAVGMLGTNRSGFYAFCLPAHGKILWQKWVTLARRNSDRVNDLDVWETADLLVNGTARLEKWLPYDVTSSKNVNVATEAGPFSSWSVGRLDLNWDREQARLRADLPTEEVKLIKAEHVSRWKVRLVERRQAAP